MTRKQALCGVVTRFPDIPFEYIRLVQKSTLQSRRHLVQHQYTLFCVHATGTGSTIQAAFDNLIQELTNETKAIPKEQKKA